MNKADQWVNIVLWVCLLVHVVVLIVGLISNKDGDLVFFQIFTLGVDIDAINF